MTKFIAKQDALIIAEAFGWDVADVRRNRYQPTVYKTVKLYDLDGCCYCCPRLSQRLPVIEGVKWEIASDYRYSGRAVFKAVEA